MLHPCFLCVYTRAEFDRVPNFGFLVGREIYALCVATSFDIRDPIVTPAMLVVADEETVGVSRERRLSGA